MFFRETKEIYREWSSVCLRVCVLSPIIGRQQTLLDIFTLQQFNRQFLSELIEIPDCGKLNKERDRDRDYG